MTHYLLPAIAGLALIASSPARAQTVADLQRQIDELKATIAEMKAAQTGTRPPVVAVSPPPVVVPPPPQQVARVATPRPARPDHWYDRVKFRGYTQLRLNEIVSGDRTTPAGVSRLRSVHDVGIGDGTNFTIRRLRVVLQGDVTDHISFYFQPDFGTSISNQTAGERREGFGQLRDAYVDTFLDDDRHFRLRFGQSKVPFGWENLQSSSNRLTLDRSDGINSAVPSERDLGVIAYYTPAPVDHIWKRLADDGQKLFGNYGAFGVGVFNGQGTNRSEENDGVMTVAMATWPFALDGLGSEFAGQVLEIGGSALRNRVRPELGEGGVSGIDFADERLGLHAILYPKPIGFQAEWNWGRGPEYDRTLGAIVTRPLEGGYVQTMLRLPRLKLMPYGRWQHYRGGWKALPGAPRLETDEFEIGVEWQPVAPLELTLAFARMHRLEADIDRAGRAEGNVIRTQLQWSY